MIIIIRQLFRIATHNDVILRRSLVNRGRYRIAEINVSFEHSSIFGGAIKLILRPFLLPMNNFRYCSKTNEKNM